jgi:hypothetical protein
MPFSIYYQTKGLIDLGFSKFSFSKIFILRTSRALNIAIVWHL